MSVIAEVPLIQQNGQPKINQQWLTAFDEEALCLKVKDRAEQLQKNLGKVVGIKEIKATRIIDKSDSNYVSWDHGKVVEVRDGMSLPFSTEFGCCIAVLARAFKEKTPQPSYVALHHVWECPNEFEGTLQTLVDATKKGTIQFFISGGMQFTKNRLERIEKIINKFVQRYPDINFEIEDNTFGIADLGNPYKITLEGMAYPTVCSLCYVGFDERQHPFQIINLVDDHNIDPITVREVRWFD
jgi:hypothetical protein